MLTSSWTELRYHELQTRAWRSSARFVSLAAGRGSGKTELARRRVVRYLAIKKPWPRPMYFYALPTYKQARRVAWEHIKALIPPNWIKGLPNESDMLIKTVYGSELYVMGLDKPQRLEGDQWDGGVVDESCDQKDRTFDLSILPALSHRNGWCWRIGVPKRTGTGAASFKLFFDAGLTAMREGKRDHESYTWPSSDILSEAQLDWAKRNLDPRDYAEQYDASWEKLGGLVFFAFDEIHSVDDQITYRPNERILVGSDFNVDPMAWILAQRVGEHDLHVFDELFIRNTNTRDVLTILHSKYPNHEAGWDFFGDATSRSRNTRASESDYVQIRNDTRFHDARIFYPQGNPRRANRFAACNAILLTADGTRRCKVHPRCRNLIRDFGTRAYKEGCADPDDYGDVGHITDGFGYLVYKVFPIRTAMPAEMPGVFTNAAY